MISAIVIDTDVISYIFKGDTRSASYYPHLNDKLALISFIVTHNRNHYIGIDGLTLISEAP